MRANGGLGVGKGPGTLYDQKKYDTPYIRDFMLDHGMICDVSETSTPWRYAAEIHTRTVAAALKAIEERGGQGNGVLSPVALLPHREPASTSPSP